MYPTYIGDCIMNTSKTEEEPHLLFVHHNCKNWDHNLDNHLLGTFKKLLNLRNNLNI